MRLGLFYGLIAGLTYTLLAWGLDAYQLGSAHVDLFWVKLAVGGALCLGLSTLVGWLAQKLDSGLAALLGWLAAGFLFAWTASHLPFEVQSWAVSLFNPHLAGLQVYPYPQNLNSDMLIVYATTVIMLGIGGILELVLVDAARNSSSPWMRGLILMFCIPFFALAGSAADSINQPLRDPLVKLSQTIQYAQESAGKPVDENQVKLMNLRALDPISNLVGRPYRLIIGNYGDQSLSSATIFIDFTGQWAICTTVQGATLYCEPSQTAYLDQLGCLFAYPGQDPARACRFKTSPSGAQFLKQWKDAGSAEVQTGVLDQHGNTILAVISGAGGTFQCRIGGAAPSYELESCSPYAGMPPSAASISPQNAVATATQGVIQAATQTAIAEANQHSILPTYSPTPAAGTPVPAPTWTPPASQGEPAFDQARAMLPAAQNDLQNLHDLTHYSLQAQIDFAGLTIQGQEQVMYTNIANVPLESLFFRLFPNGGVSYGNGSLTVSKVIFNGSSLATSLSVENSALQVRLPQPLQPASSILLDLDFQGSVPSGPYDPGFGIYSSHENVMVLDGWFPLLAVYESCASQYDDKCWRLDPVSSMGDSVYSLDSYFDVTLSVPANLVVATTGSSLSKDTQGDTTTYMIASGPARDFLVTMSPDFSLESRDVNGVTINSYYLPDRKAGGLAALATAADSLKFYNSTFGAYPYRELDVVETPLKDASGVEFPGIILIGSDLYNDSESTTFTGTVAHEVAHQWWYGVVGDDVFSDPWMDEALASYSAAAYFGSAYGPQGYQGYMDYYQQRYDKYLESHPDEGVAESLAHFEQAKNPAGYSAIVYAKGALFFDAVRKEIGEQAFNQALQFYFQSYKYEIARPQHLEDAFELVSGKDLHELYNQWLEK